MHSSLNIGAIFIFTSLVKQKLGPEIQRHVRNFLLWLKIIGQAMEEAPSSRLDILTAPPRFFYLCDVNHNTIPFFFSVFWVIVINFLNFLGCHVSHENFCGRVT